MEASLEYRQFVRMRKRLGKAYNLMTKAQLRYRQSRVDRDKSFSRRNRLDRSHQTELDPRVMAAVQRCNLAYEHYLRCQAKYEACKRSYAQQMRQLRCDMRPLACKIGIPQQYLDKFHVSVKKDGEIHFYYGGEDKPVGKGHAHVVVNSDHTLKYWRYPKATAQRAELFAEIA